MPASRRRPRALKLVAAKPRPEFTDVSSQRVVTAAARAVARELGRTAADVYFDRMMGLRK